MLLSIDEHTMRGDIIMHPSDICTSGVMLLSIDKLTMSGDNNYASLIYIYIYEGCIIIMYI